MPEEELLSRGKFCASRHHWPWSWFRTMMKFILAPLEHCQDWQCPGCPIVEGWARWPVNAAHTE